LRSREDWGRERRKTAKKGKWVEEMNGTRRGGMEGKVKPLPNKNSGCGLVVTCFFLRHGVH